MFRTFLRSTKKIIVIVPCPQHHWFEKDVARLTAFSTAILMYAV